MNSRDTLLRILNVRRSEWKLVRTLFFFEFFQGAGIAFFFTAAFALFLDNYHITQLPVVLICSAFLLWMAGYVYSRLEGRVRITSLAKGVTLFMAGSFLLFRFALSTFPPGILFVMLAWFNVLYMLNNLEFWGITSLLFDVRQSKRLFGLISAGDIPAKFVGYTVALLLVGTIGTENLLWAGFFCMLASYPCIRTIAASGYLAKHEHHHEQTRHAAHSVAHLAKNFSANVLIRRIALITVIASCCFLIVNFSFYAKVKEAVHDDVDLAQFIAFFYAIVRLVALFVKMVFTGRLINKLGIIRSLLVTPLLMILLVGIVLAFDYGNIQERLSLYLFGAMAIFVDVLRTSINAPVFLTLMQPLGTHERLRAHTITKGIMDPFASLLTGVLLLVVLRFNHDQHLSSLNYILLTLGVLWIAGIYRVHQQYLHTLLRTISNRFFQNAEFSISDSSTLNWVREKLKRGSETEALNILKMLAAHPRVFGEEVLLAALEHPSDAVKTMALELADEKNIFPPNDRLRELLLTSSHPPLTAVLIKMLCKNKVQEAEILPFIEDTDSTIQKAALVGILKCGSAEVKEKAHAYLLQMTASGQAETKRRAALILQELNDPAYSDEVLRLMNDADGQVVQAALLAGGKTGTEELAGHLLQKLHAHEAIVLNALEIAGQQALWPIKAFILERKASRRQTERLIRLIGRIGGKKAHKILAQLMEELVGYPHIIIKTFYQSNYIGSLEQRHFFEAQARNCLKNCASLLYMQQLLAPYGSRYELLYTSLELELVNLRDTLLYIFALLYDKEKVKDVRAAFTSGDREAVANAMEIIEMTIPKETANHFNLIFEPSELEHKVYALRRLYPSSFFTNIETVLSTILRAEDFPYDNWTRACSLYTSKKQHHTINHNLINRYLEAEHPLLSELARMPVGQL